MFRDLPSIASGVHAVSIAVEVPATLAGLGLNPRPAIMTISSNAKRMSMTWAWSLGQAPTVASVDRARTEVIPTTGFHVRIRPVSMLVASRPTTRSGGLTVNAKPVDLSPVHSLKIAIANAFLASGCAFLPCAVSGEHARALRGQTRRTRNSLVSHIREDIKQ
jgi:hypothetical protein